MIFEKSERQSNRTATYTSEESLTNSFSCFTQLDLRRDLSPFPSKKNRIQTHKAFKFSCSSQGTLVY
jgi:hypothetical protein